MTPDNDNAALDFSIMLANSVHDIKNSLSTVITTLDELTTEIEGNEKSHGKLATLKYESKRINSQLIALLTLYKFENKQYHLLVSDHLVNDVIEDAALPYHELLKSKNIELTVNCEENLVWFFDDNLIAGIINNIINNAYRYSRDSIKVTGEISDNMLVISIEDNGQGYPTTLLSQDNPSQKSISFQTGSTGLGLYFSKTIAELHENKGHHGSIKIDNQGINQGGRFRLFLP